ncbi:RTC4-like domain-containing protein [Schizophyllum commune]
MIGHMQRALSPPLDLAAISTRPPSVLMNRNPSLTRVGDASSSRLYKMPSRSVIEPEKSGLQRGRGRDGREDLGMPKPNRPARKPVLRDLSDDSDDELEHPWKADISANRITRTVSPQTPEELDPTYQKKRSNTYKNLSFKKISKSGDASAGKASTSKAPAEPIDLTNSPRKRRSPSPSRRPLKHQFINASRSPTRRARVPSPPPPITDKPRTNRFVKPKPVAAPNKRQPEANPKFNPFNKNKLKPPERPHPSQRRSSPPSKRTSIVIDDEDSSGGVEEVNGPEEDEEASFSRSLRKRTTLRLTTPEAAPFPMDLTPKKRPQPQAFPMSDDSPLSSPPKRASDPFPMSPLSSQAKAPSYEDGDSDEDDFPTSDRVRAQKERAVDKGKGKATFVAPKPKPKPTLKARPPPFSQFVPSSHDDTPRSGNKRFSDDGLSEGERDAKRPRSTSPSSSAYEPIGDDDPDLSLGPASRDARELCPYCDELLPSSPTPTLTRMLEEVAKKSRSAPRPSNPRGRKAQLRHFAIVCQRHRFERDVLPDAERKGWPKKIDWSALPSRVRRLRDELQEILEDEIDHGGCVFWKELAKEIKEKGTRAATGVAGQFENFEKVQIGYYGEQGAAIITQTLYSMFPMDLIDPDKVFPLSPSEFLQRVLLPEAGLRLIEEDRGRGASDALRTLRESAKYGVAMFPDDSGVGGRQSLGGNAGGGGVADGIVMARAARRRQQIEAEERREEEEEAANARARPRPKPRPVRKEATGSSLMDVEEDGQGGGGGMSDGARSTGRGGRCSSDMEVESDDDGWLSRQRPPSTAGSTGETEMDVDVEQTPKPPRSREVAEPTRKSDRIPRLRSASVQPKDSPKRASRSRSTSVRLADTMEDDAGDVIELSSEDTDDEGAPRGKPSSQRSKPSSQLGKPSSQRSRQPSRPPSQQSKPSSRRQPPSRPASRATSVANDSSSSFESLPLPPAKPASGLAAARARLAARRQQSEDRQVPSKDSFEWLLSDE